MTEGDIYLAMICNMDRSKMAGVSDKADKALEALNEVLPGTSYEIDERGYPEFIFSNNGSHTRVSILAFREAPFEYMANCIISALVGLKIESACKRVNNN